MFVNVQIFADVTFWLPNLLAYVHACIFEHGRGNKLVDDVMDLVTTNVPAMAHARKHVHNVVEQLRSASRSHFRQQVCP